MEVSCRDADEQPLTVDGRTEGKFKGQSTDAHSEAREAHHHSWLLRKQQGWRGMGDGKAFSRGNPMLKKHQTI